MSIQTRWVEESLTGATLHRPEGLDVPAGQPQDTADVSKLHYENYKALVARTVEVFGDEIKAVRWLSTPSVDFKNLVPIQVAQDVDYSATELERLFEPVFIRIEHGIYT